MSFVDYYPSLAHLSLGELESSSRRWSHPSSSSRLLPLRWSVPAWQSYPTAPSYPAYSGFAPNLSYHIPPYLPELECKLVGRLSFASWSNPIFVVPSSPSENGSSVSSDLSFTPPPQPQSLHVICNAPLIAPKPLPYHSPTFLKFELLPDLDEDLSHPPYTQRPSKRKREDSDESADLILRKRRASGVPSALPPRPPSVSSRHRKPTSVRRNVYPHRAQK